MIKAVLAVRHSQAVGPRRAVLLALATYTDQDGNNAFPKWETLVADSGASRPTVHRAIKDALKFGEIECTGQRKSKTQIYSFAPLIRHSLTLRRSHPETPIVSEDQGIVSPGDSHSLTLRPDQAVSVKEQKKNKNIPRDARLVGNPGLSRSGISNNGKAKHVDAAQIKAAQERHAREERQRREDELAILLTQQASKPSERTARAIDEMRAQLDSKLPEAA